MVFFTAVVGRKRAQERVLELIYEYSKHVTWPGGPERASNALIFWSGVLLGQSQEFFFLSLFSKGLFSVLAVIYKSSVLRVLHFFNLPLLFLLLLA